MICVSLGGRIAEEIFFGKVTTGAADDIKKVTQYAGGLVTVYGMSEKMGLVGYHSDYDTSVPPSHAGTNEEIDEEVRRIVKECYARTKVLLESKKELMHS